MSTTAGQKLEDVGEKVGEVASDAAEKGWEGVRAVLEYRLLHLGDVEVTVGGVIAAVLTLLVVLVVSRLVRRALDRYGRQHLRTDAATLYTVSRIVHYLLLAIGVVIALELIGLSVGKFTVFAGALGIGLGFGLQAIFNNFVSGLILLFDKSLKIGDFVELEEGTRGTVQAINIRATRITTNDNIDILVPNSEFVSGRVTNWTHRSTERRLRVPFTVAYGVDKELVKKAALEAAAKVPFTQSMEGPQAPQVWLVGFGDSGVEFVLAVWLGDQAARRNAAIQAAYLWELDTALKAHGIEIPFPQRDLHLRSAFGLTGAEAIAALRGERPSTAASPEAREMDPDERSRLSRNDAREEAEREIEDERMREEAREEARAREEAEGREDSRKPDADR
jgi:small-conductance mechanosensitive channel